MVFTSLNFLIFFPVIIILYYITPQKQKWITLLVSSYVFYINIKPVLAFLLIAVTLPTYFFTREISKTNIESRKQRLMVINILLILLPLFFFKYYNALNAGVISLLTAFRIRWALPEIKLILPFGISFYTFTTIGYVIDVYNERIKAENNLGILALFIVFFPLILSGPIERAQNIIPQFKKGKTPDYTMVSKGFKLMLWGFFMKLVVADRLGIYVDAVYTNISHHSGTSLLLASFLYPFQLYTDLGGYSLIAIGAAKVMGINVMKNFLRPFFATTISEFWRRWHISLISWLTDYIYTPLSFKFRGIGIWGIVSALLITFMISGLWHGAALSFIIWGVMQGVFLSIEAITIKKRTKFENKYNIQKKGLYIFWGICVTYVLFTSSLIFSRAASLNYALQIYDRIFTVRGQLFIGPPSTLIFSLLGLFMVLLKDFIEEFKPSRLLLFDSKNKIIRIISYSSIVILILLIGVFDGGQFIYFQF